MRNRLNYGLIAIFFILWMFGCSPIGREAGSFVEFNSSGMEKDHEYCFDGFYAYVNDSLGNEKNVYINIRYTLDFPFRYLPLRIEETSSESDSVISTFIEIPLFDSKGNPLERNLHSLYETEFLLHKDMPIDSVYSIWISTPLEDTGGLKSLGVFIK